MSRPSPSGSGSTQSERSSERWSLTKMSSKHLSSFYKLYDLPIRVRLPLSSVRGMPYLKGLLGNVLFRDFFEDWLKVSFALERSYEFEALAPLSNLNSSKRLEGFVGLLCFGPCILGKTATWILLSSCGFIFMYNIEKFWYFHPRLKRVSLVSHAPDNNRG